MDLATTVNRSRTDALQRRPYCLPSEGAEREYKRTGREEQGRSRQQQQRLVKTAGVCSDMRSTSPCRWPKAS